MKRKPTFPRYLYSLLLMLLLTGSVSKAFPQVFSESSDSLYHFVETWSGVWIQGDHPIVWDEEPTASKWVVQLDPRYVAGDEVAVLLSEYYRDGIVDVLWFGYESGSLVYQGATKDGRWLDMSRLDFARLIPVEENGKQALVLELLEAEVENYVYAPMLNMPPESHPGWAWGLQKYLLAFLDGGSYDVLTKDGIPTSLDQAFARDNVRDEIAFVENHAVLFPMFEEICLQAPFDLILVGDGHPAGELLLYAVDWNPFGIFLYEAEMGPMNQDGHYSISKGELTCTIVPTLPIAPIQVTQ